MPQFLEELYDFPDGNFSLLRRGRRIGIGFKAMRADGDVRLAWIKLTDMIRVAHQWQGNMIDALQHFAIPAER